MTLFGVLCYCRFFRLKGWNVPMLPLEEELQELVEGKRQKPGDLWELVCSVDAEGISPMSLAIESGNAQWMTAYVNKDALSYLNSCDEGEQNSLSYQTRCKYLISASSAIAKLLSSQELGSLSDPLSDLLKLFVLPAEKNPYKSNGQPVLNRGNATIQLHPLVSETIWWPQGFEESQIAHGCRIQYRTGSRYFCPAANSFKRLSGTAVRAGYPRCRGPYSRALPSWPQYNSSGKHGNGITTVNALCTLFSNFCTCGSQCRALML